MTRGRSLTEQQTPPEVPAGLPSSLERRPDIQAAENPDRDQRQHRGRQGSLFSANYADRRIWLSKHRAGEFVLGSRRIWNFVPQLTQPIYTAGRLTSQVELAEAQQRSALARYENSIQTGFRDVSDALIQYQKVREVRAQREFLVTALQDRKRLAYLRFRGGVDTMLNALNSDQDLFVAELSLAQARLNELLFVQLYKALGWLAVMNTLSVSGWIDDSPEIDIVASYIVSDLLSKRKSAMHHARSFLTVLFLVGSLAGATRAIAAEDTSPPSVTNHEVNVLRCCDCPRGRGSRYPGSPRSAD